MVWSKNKGFNLHTLEIVYKKTPFFSRLSQLSELTYSLSKLDKPVWLIE